MERALIIQRQHLERIFDHGKTWEMRGARTRVRGRIGLIESGSGLIVGEVELLDCLPALRNVEEAEATKKLHQVDDLSKLEKWKYPWVILGAQRYEKPIPYTHPQGAVIWVRLSN